MDKWTMKHEGEFLTATEPKDARGLKFTKECGYRWVNLNDGNGWLQIEVLIRRAEIREAVRAA